MQIKELSRLLQEPWWGWGRLGEEVRKAAAESQRNWEWRCHFNSKHLIANTFEEIMASYSCPASNSLGRLFSLVNSNPEPHRERILQNVAPSLRRKWQWCQGNKVSSHRIYWKLCIYCFGLYSGDKAITFQW